MPSIHTYYGEMNTYKVQREKDDFGVFFGYFLINDK